MTGAGRAGWSLVAAVAVAVVFAASAAAGGGPHAPSVPPPAPGFALTWVDDFNGLAGWPLDPFRWIYDTGTGYGCAGCPQNWGTFEIETMTHSTQNVGLDGHGNRGDEAPPGTSCSGHP